MGKSLAEPLVRELVNPEQSPLTFATLLSQKNEDLIIRIDGSSSVATENESITKFLEAQDDQIEVDIDYQGSDVALEALQEGDIDIAGIGRPLTEEEEGEGLKAIALPRRKIAIVVGADNPFDGVLNINQFAKIFRGEITNWEEVGGIDREIRFIDRPLDSDTRENFKNYPVFQNAEFKTGSTVDRVSEDRVRAVIDRLGDYGIGYMIADQALTQTGIHIVSMHSVPVTDPRYPFSQSRYYVYNKSPNPAVKRLIQAAVDLDFVDEKDVFKEEESREKESNILTPKDDNASSEKELEPIIASPKNNISVAPQRAIPRWLIGLLLILALFALLWLLWRKYREKLLSTISLLKQGDFLPFLPTAIASKGGYNSPSLKTIKLVNLSLPWVSENQFVPLENYLETEENWISFHDYDVLTLNVLKKPALWLCGLFLNIPKYNPQEQVPLYIWKDKYSEVKGNSTNQGNSLLSIDDLEKWYRFGNFQLLNSYWHQVQFTPPFEPGREVIVIPEIQSNPENKPYQFNLRNVNHQGFELYCDGETVGQKVTWTAYSLITTAMTIVSSDSQGRTEDVTIININATINNQDNPIVKSFPAGNYEVKVIGTEAGGDYDAWSPWDFVYQCDENGENCLTGWVNSYSITSEEFTNHIATNGIFSQDYLALNKAQNTSLTLKKNSQVNFFIIDDQLGDNLGGISLAVIKISPQIERQVGILERLNSSQLDNNWYPVKFPQPFAPSQEVIVIPMNQSCTKTAPVLQTRNVNQDGFEISCQNPLDAQSNYLIGWLAYGYGQRVTSNGLEKQNGNTIIINIDATINNQDNAIIKKFPRGTYEVKVIGQQTGGIYEGWSRWSWGYGCDNHGENCIMGWENSYLIVSPEFFLNIPASSLYEQPLQALMNAQSTSFTLTSESEVYFFIYDEEPDDNRGGISLAITRIATPELPVATEEIKTIKTNSTMQPLQPDPGKRIVMTTYGSLGDVHPYLAIAQELKARGHYPAIAMGESFRKNIEAEAIDFLPIRPDLSLYLQQQNWEWINVLRENQREIEHDICYNLMPHLRSTYIDLKQAVADADLLITHPLCFAGALVAEVTEIPWISTVLSPLAMMSAYDLPGESSVLNSGYGDALKLVANDSLLRFSRWQARYWSAPVRQLRADLALAPSYDPVFEGQHSPNLVLALFSSLLASPQPDWPPQTCLTGFPFYNHSSEQQLSPQLQHFLDNGEPPVIFTLGSSFVWTPGNFYLEAIKAVHTIGHRAVLLMGQGVKEIDPQELPEGIMAVNYAPYSAIFPYAAAIVHHGGVGTTGQALLSGRPMLIVPFAHDQPDNAARVTRLGVGRSINRQEYTAERLVFELKELLFDPSYATKAKEASQLIELEDGVKKSCDLIEAYLQ